MIKKSSTANADSGSNNNLVNFLVPGVNDEENDHDQTEEFSWFLPPKKAVETEVRGGAGEMIFSDFEHLLEFDDPNQVYLDFKNNLQYVPGSDRVVPVQIKPEIFSRIGSNDRCFDIDFCKSKLPLYNFDTNSKSTNHSVSISTHSTPSHIN